MAHQLRSSVRSRAPEATFRCQCSHFLAGRGQKQLLDILLLGFLLFFSMPFAKKTKEKKRKKRLGIVLLHKNVKRILKNNVSKSHRKCFLHITSFLAPGK